jgi:hypothetical protein
MKVYGSVEVQLHYFYASAPDAGEWVNFKPRPLYPRGGACGTPWIGDTVGPAAGR